MPGSLSSQDLRVSISLEEQLAIEKRHLNLLRQKTVPLKILLNKYTRRLYHGRGFIECIWLNIVDILSGLNEAQMVKVIMRDTIKSWLRRHRKQLENVLGLIDIVETNIILLNVAIEEEKRGVKKKGADYIAGYIDVPRYVERWLSGDH